ncbi:MAG: helix-turn-helix domain-containing protein [Bifidobacterium mongoliense]|nr:helix-turn-helix domain-containing protein [Bifidobacterium mongoliense]MDN6024989.1 helix-turn-helix domain-containing protein [Bifidobacterium mongoliense]
MSFPNRAKVVADYRRGDAVKDIAARYSIHRSTVTEVLSRAEVPARRYGLPEPVRKEAAQLYTQGLGIRTVADRLGISYAGARAGIVGYGVALRPSGRQPRR